MAPECPTYLKNHSLVSMSPSQPNRYKGAHTRAQMDEENMCHFEIFGMAGQPACIYTFLGCQRVKPKTYIYIIGS